MFVSFVARADPSMIRRLLVAEDSPLGDSPAPLASCQVGLRLTALSLILACSVRFAGLNAAGATTTCDWSTCSLQASTARTSDAVRAPRGLASGEHERKGGGRSRHGLRQAEAHRPPQTVFVYLTFLLDAAAARDGRQTLRHQARGRLAPRWRRWRRRSGWAPSHVTDVISVPRSL